ncbi:putative gustatory receptor 28b isoform X3 [Hermetia illucens]|uniref:putative gustatory receptor 28b isoform X3 n=1 Tax=Hermetia illucens TaxID=343691 RepID=UPI0018CC70BF|nr:putative gustatory receptor 28b isoform X3 [Hermetia illucens]
MKDLWSELRDPVDIYASLIPLFCVTFMSGISPLVLGGRRGRRVLMTSFVGTLNTLTYIIVIAVCWYWTYQLSSPPFIKDVVTKVGSMLEQLCAAIVTLVIYLFSFYHRHTIIAIVKTLADIDVQLLSLGVKVNYKKMFHYSCVSFSALILFMFLYYVACTIMGKVTGIEVDVPSYIFHLIQNSILMIIVYMFACFTRLISDRFIVLNKVLVNMIEQFVNKTDVSRKKSIPFTREPSDKFMSWVTVLKTHDETIEEVAHIHDMLCDLATITNDFFTVQMLAITGIAFLIIVFDAYYVLGTYLGLASFRATAFIIFFSSQLILHAIEVCVIVHGSSEAVSQSQMTSIYVHKLLNLTKVESLKDILYKLSLQLIHRKVVFDAAGFFVLDRTLFFTICGATTTYLIILLQFSKENDTKLVIGDSTTTEATNASLIV